MLIQKQIAYHAIYDAKMKLQCVSFTLDIYQSCGTSTSRLVNQGEGLKSEER